MRKIIVILFALIFSNIVFADTSIPPSSLVIVFNNTNLAIKFNFAFCYTGPTLIEPQCGETYSIALAPDAGKNLAFITLPSDEVDENGKYSKHYILEIKSEEHRTPGPSPLEGITIFNSPACIADPNPINKLNNANNAITITTQGNTISCDPFKTDKTPIIQNS